MYNYHHMVCVKKNKKKKTTQIGYIYHSTGIVPTFSGSAPWYVCMIIQSRKLIECVDNCIHQYINKYLNTTK